MKNLIQTLTVSFGILLTTGLSNGQTLTSPAPATNRVAGSGLNITLAEHAATVRQIAEDASKGFDPAKHAQELTRQINEILATLPPSPPSTPTNTVALKPTSTGSQVAPAPGPAQEPERN